VPYTLTASEGASFFSKILFALLGRGKKKRKSVNEFRSKRNAEKREESVNGKQRQRVYGTSTSDKPSKCSDSLL
jgi:hypothetical protein